MSDRPQVLDRRLAWLCVLGLGAGLALAAGLLVPWTWVPGGGALQEVPVNEAFTAAQVARAESYHRLVRPLGWALLVAPAVVALLLALAPPVVRATRRISRRLPRLGIPVLTAFVLAVTWLTTLPLRLAVRERRLEFGLTRQGLAGWLADQALSLVVSWTLLTIVVVLVVGSARRWQRRWFLPAGAAVAGSVFVGSLLYPLTVEPLFNSFDPLPPSGLRTSLLALAAREGVPVDEVLVADASRRTTTLNAYVSGLAGPRRVVVYDTLVEDLPDPQVRAVVAHELAHARHRDVLLGTGLGALGAAVGVCVLALLLDSGRFRRATAAAAAGEPAATVAVVAFLAVTGLVTAPATNVVSRAIEVRADRDALAATGDPAAFVALQRRLAVRSLADPTPLAWAHWAFGSHPTPRQRMGLPAALGLSSGGAEP